MASDHWLLQVSDLDLILFSQVLIVLYILTFGCEMKSMSRVLIETDFCDRINSVVIIGHHRSAFKLGLYSFHVFELKEFLVERLLLEELYTRVEVEEDLPIDTLHCVVDCLIHVYTLEIHGVERIEMFSTSDLLEASFHDELIKECSEEDRSTLMIEIKFLMILIGHEVLHLLNSCALILRKTCIVNSFK
jgi:hypothetical protein